MKVIGILLIIVGVIGGVMGSIMYGDIGIAAWIGSVIGILSGIGFIKVDSRIKSLLK